MRSTRRGILVQAGALRLPIAGKGGSDWSYAWVPILGPAVGGVITGLFLRWLGA